MLAFTAFALCLMTSGERVESPLTPEEAMRGTRMPKALQGTIELVDVNYFGFDGAVHQGQIQVAAELAEEVRAIFSDLTDMRFPITRVVPVTRYGWSDSASIRDNNTSAFNYRLVITPGGGRGVLSRHAKGTAIDLNPFLNPMRDASGHGPRLHDPSVPGTIYEGSPVIEAFRRRGWIWGGDWANGRDYQHFEKS